MEWTSLNDLREKYLSYFESKGHLRLQSFSLVPNNDNSLLLINSGMAPMKKFFTGEVTPPRSRVTTCQKCIRTPDLERVGHTARHGTYFEMLGNFSFGDYFKNEAIPFAWEFLTVTLAIPEDKLWPSIYENDEEAFKIWHDVMGVPAERIIRLGKEDNFWEHGTGPCGPCSEIYFDRGEKYGCGSPDCKPGCDCDRYMEIWNNVFSQFNNMGDGNYEELKTKNIDTGMGLERLACIMQGVDNMFEVDTVRSILNKVCSLSGREYGADSNTDISIRAVTDHARAATFMISDGIIPSNEGRGYVLRRLIRRASRHGRLIGINEPFLPVLCDAVIKENEGAYPELREKRELIKKVISFEEAAFAKTIDQGLAMLEGITLNGGQLSGEDAFRLYDTYGFPLDLTKDILAEKGMTVDEDTFTRLMEEQRSLARSSRKAADAESWKSDGISFDGIEKTEFCGYTDNCCDAVILDIVSSGEHSPASAEGEKAALILDRTSFYAESGGQVADTGVITANGAVFRVSSVSKTPGGVFVHAGEVESGMFSTGGAVKTEIDIPRRESIRRNHTAAHLLQAALRNVLGTHVEQAGQLVSDAAVRFDFTHFSAMTAEELSQVEEMVNQWILSGIAVDNKEMPIEEARKLGAMALFGEKYGDRVRVVAAADKSIEFCGGTHVDNTAKIGLFHIVSESGVAAGVRRIEAVTGKNVLGVIAHYKSLVGGAAEYMKLANFEDLPQRAKQLAAEAKEREKRIESLEAKLAAGKTDDIMKNAVEISGIRTAAAQMGDIPADELRRMSDTLKAENPDAAVVLASVCGGKLTFCAFCGAQAVAKGAHAGNLVREIAKITGGNGGGKPDSAMAGGKDVSKLAEALEAVSSMVAKQIGG